MKLTTNNFNRAYDNEQRQNKAEVLSNRLPKKYNDTLNNSTLTFGAKLPDIVKDVFVGSTKILSEKQLETIKNTVNDKAISSTLDTIGTKTDSGFSYKQAGLFSDLVSTIKYPFKDMWLDIASSFIKNPKKDGIIDKHIQKINTQKAQQTALDIVSQFDTKNEKGFVDIVARNLAKDSANYKNRDERTLNRMLTSTVSALYSANDFYNISMLQKDDKKEASKAQKSRFKQEISRMALSAGLTFITMGELDKHIKNNMFLSACSIGISALISEVGSRLINKTPIRPLTPEKAQEYAQKKNKNKKTDTKQPQVAQQNSQNAEKTPFKGSLTNTALFKDFAQKDGSFASLNILKEFSGNNTITANSTDSKDAKPKSKLKSILKMIGAAAVAASALHLAGKTKLGAKASGFFKNIENFICKKTEIIDGDELTNFKKYVDGIDSKELQPVIDRYKELLNGNSTKGIKPTDKIKIDSNRFLISGLYNGVTKVFKTLYTILSAPAKGLVWAYDKISKKPTVNKTAMKNDKKSIVELYKLYNENKDKGEIGKNEVINQLKKRTRNFEPKIETGDLANFSRTLVTVISTYFFVNDYRNKVLIESEGKDVAGAEAEVKQRLGHKLANFIINGTIMNVGNSLFKKQLNSSLLAAGAIAIAEETTNEALVRKSICQPIAKKKSKEEIIEFEEKQLNKKGLMGAWSRMFRKLTGKKTLTEKAGVKVETLENKTNKTK